MKVIPTYIELNKSMLSHRAAVAVTTTRTATKARMRERAEVSKFIKKNE
jgi:hypothetical protein